MRTLNMSNDKGRNAEVHYVNHKIKSSYTFVDFSGQPIVNKKYIKSTSKFDLDSLVESYGSIEAVAEEIISGDPEIDMEVTGQFLQNSSRVYVNEDENIVYRIKKTEKVYDHLGELKEEREYVQKKSNINGEIPIRWTGKHIPKESFFRKFVSMHTYRITHDSGLKYDFLFDMATKLSEQNAMMLIAGGEQGNQPLIMQDSGKPYRAFLEGRVKGEQYLLLMHLTNMELKPIPQQTEKTEE